MTPLQKTTGDLDMGNKSSRRIQLFFFLFMARQANLASLRQKASEIKAASDSDPAQGTAPALPPLPPESACFSQAD